MTKVLILGANGNIARRVEKILGGQPDVGLTLFVRRRPAAFEVGEVVVGDVLDYHRLLETVRGKDIVYANLAGELGPMARNIVRAMNEAGVGRLIFISSIGIYQSPLRAVLRPYREAADAVESSDLDYTLIRPAWFTQADEVDYEITLKGEPERGSVISETSLATFIAGLIMKPDQYVRQSVGINKPVREGGAA